MDDSRKVNQTLLIFWTNYSSSLQVGLSSAVSDISPMFSTPQWYVDLLENPISMNSPYHGSSSAGLTSISLILNLVMWCTLKLSQVIRNNLRYENVTIDLRISISKHN